MKIFPYILVRLGGLPFDWMEDLSMEDKEELEDYLEQLSKFNNSKTELVRILEKSPEELHCGFMLKCLYQLKVDLEKGRRLKLPARFDENLLESERPFFEYLITKITDYRGLKKTLLLLRGSFQKVYSIQLAFCRKKLKAQSRSDVLKKGLLMSSWVLLGQLSKYQDKAINDFRKKEAQTERAVLQYLSRICAKTSPFSTFTTLGIFSFLEKPSDADSANSAIRLNNDLFALWRDILNNYPPFYFGLLVGLNPCLRKEKNNWTFLLNSRNVESVQSIETNELLEYIIDLFSKPHKKWTYNQILEKLLNNVEADRKGLESYLIQLINYNFLEWQWPFSGLDPFWDQKLTIHLGNRKTDTYLAQFAKSLEQIQDIKALYSQANSDHRKKIIKQAYELSKGQSAKLLKEVQSSDNQETINLKSFQRFKPGKFTIPIEKLFYEDVSVPFHPTFKESEVKEVIKELDKLLDLLNYLEYNHRKESLKLFFNNHYEENATVDLFSFYKAFYKTEQPKNTELRSNKVKQQLSWQQAIFNHFKVSMAGILKIDLPFLKTLASSSPVKEKREQVASIGSLIHFFKDQGQLKGFSDISFQGFGKMMGRFLHLFPEPITKALQDWNLEHMGKLLWVENTDASLYNPNVHPPLIPYEIKIPGSQNTLPTEQQIPVSELIISKDSENGELILVHLPTACRVFIFDMGFEAPESRSPLYQMLLGFSYQAPSQSVLANIVNHRFLKKTKPGIIQMPRIEIGEKLIIQRRKWLVPKGLLPMKPPAEKESYYFLRINAWRIENQIPSKVFITVNQQVEKGSSQRKDDYKPQYIDFESPLLVQLFHKSIKKVEEQLKIEEVLPFPAERIGNQSFVSEYLVQWEREDLEA